MRYRAFGQPSFISSGLSLGLVIQEIARHHSGLQGCLKSAPRLPYYGPVPLDLEYGLMDCLHLVGYHVRVSLSK